MTEYERECLRGPWGCEGPVTTRASFSGTGLMVHECAKHMDDSYERDAKLRERYPVHAPSDFDPSYAGERWDEDY